MFTWKQTNGSSRPNPLLPVIKLGLAAKGVSITYSDLHACFSPVIPGYPSLVCDGRPIEEESRGRKWQDVHEAHEIESPSTPFACERAVRCDHMGT